MTDGPVDPFGDPLPAAALARMGTRRLSHWSPTDCLPRLELLAFTAEGKVLAVDSGKRARLWDPETGAELGAPAVIAGPWPEEGWWFFRDGAISPDGRLLALAGERYENEGGVLLVDVAKRQVIRDLRLGPAGTVAFSPDGALLAAGLRVHTVGEWPSPAPMVRLFDTATWAETGALAGHGLVKKTIETPMLDVGLDFEADRDADIHGLAFSPDGRTLASAGEDGSVRLWDVAGGRELRRLASGGGEALSVAFSADGALLATGWSAGPVLVFVLADPDAAPLALGDEPPLARLRCPLAFASTAAPGPVELAYASEPSFVQVFDARSGATRLRLRAAGAGPLAFSRDGRTLVASSHYGSIHLFDAHSGAERLAARHTGGVASVAFSADGARVLSGSDDGTARIWDASSGREVARLEPGGAQVAWSPDGALVAIAGFGAACVVDVASGREVFRFEIDGEPLESVAFSPDGRLLAAGDGSGTVRLWAGGTWSLVLALEPPPKKVPPCGADALAFAPDGTLLVGYRSSQVRLFDLGTRREAFLAAAPRLHKPPGAHRLGLAVSQDGSTLATGTREGVCLFDLERARAAPDEVEPFARLGPGPGYGGIALAPHAPLLAFGAGDGALRIRGVRPKRKLARFTGHEGLVTAVAFSPDGTRLASGGADGLVYTWPVAP